MCSAPSDKTHGKLKPLRLLATMLTVSIALGVVLLGREVMTGRLEMRPVLSGSMRPGLAVGGLVIATRVERSSLHVRDVIIIHRPDDPSRLVVHRIIKLETKGDQTLIQTMGDNNPSPDPWQASLRGRYAYKARYSIPLLGYPSVYLKRPVVRRDMTIGAGIVLFLVALSSAFRREKPQPVDSDHSHAAASVAVAQIEQDALRLEEEPAPDRALVALRRGSG